jgi:hypothetical protein
MDRQGFLGGSPLGVALRLALLSLAVGIVLDTLGINLSNVFDRLNALLRNIYDLGFGAVDWLLQYLLIGAVVVVPVWLIARLVSMSRKKSQG